MEVQGLWGKRAAQVSGALFPALPPRPLDASSWCQPCSHGNHLLTAETQPQLGAAWLGPCFYETVLCPLKGSRFHRQAFLSLPLSNQAFISVATPSFSICLPLIHLFPALPLSAAELGQCQIMLYSQPEELYKVWSLANKELLLSV